MASITWPAGLPQKPRFDSFTETRPNITISSSVSVGPPKKRRRATGGSSRVKMQFNMTTSQISTLETFYETTTSFGADKFDFTHPRTDSTVEARFMGTPTWRPIGPSDWIVEANMEFLP